MRKCLRQIAVAATLCLLFGTGVEAGYNEVIEVEVGERDKFTERPDPNQDDRITVTTENVNITDWSIEADPRRDKATLAKTDKNKIDVIRRGGVGALYRVEGEYTDSDDSEEDGGWWGGDEGWWAEAKDKLFGGTSVLTDKVPSPEVSVGDAGNGAPPFFCEVGTDRKGHVGIRLGVEEGTYDWEISSDGNVLWDGTLSGEDYEDFVDSQDGIDPGEYKLKVSDVDTGGVNFSREIDFEVIGIKITEFSVELTTSTGNYNITTDAKKLTKDIMKAVMLNIIIDQVKETLIYFLTGKTFGFAMGIPTAKLGDTLVESFKLEVKFDAYKGGDGTWEDGLIENKFESRTGSWFLLDKDEFEHLTTRFIDNFKSLAEDVVEHNEKD